MWGDPIYVRKTADADALESHRQELQTTLIDLTEKADTAECGK